MHYTEVEEIPVETETTLSDNVNIIQPPKPSEQPASSSSVLSSSTQVKKPQVQVKLPDRKTEVGVWQRPRDKLVQSTLVFVKKAS